MRTLNMHERASRWRRATRSAPTAARITRRQRPGRVPFDLAAELHLKFDAVAVAYRKAMRASGLASGTPIGIETDADG